jgi:hypothetical protein
LYPIFLLVKADIMNNHYVIERISRKYFRELNKEKQKSAIYSNVYFTSYLKIEDLIIERLYKIYKTRNMKLKFYSDIRGTLCYSILVKLNFYHQIDQTLALLQS